MRVPTKQEMIRELWGVPELDERYRAKIASLAWQCTRRLSVRV